MGSLRLIVGLVLSLVVVSFGVQNMARVKLSHWRVGQLELPLFFALVAAFSLGFFCAWALGLWEKVKALRGIREREGRLRALEAELKGLKERSLEQMLAPSPSPNPSPGAPPSEAQPTPPPGREEASG
ncbi:MAG: LapA family protein [Nitrospinota bacterium]